MHLPGWQPSILLMSDQERSQAIADIPRPATHDLIESASSQNVPGSIVVGVAGCTVTTLSRNL